MAKNKKTFFEIIHNATKKHWIWYTIIIFLPTLWFSYIIPVWGEYGLIDSQKKYTNTAIVISIIICVLSFMITVLNNWYASKSEFGELENLRGHVEYLQQVTDSVDAICDEKYVQLRKIIQQVCIGQEVNPKIISNPNNQLKKILEQIVVCLIKFMEKPDEPYAYKDFYVHLAYNFPEENTEWKWLDGTIERGMSLSVLMAGNSTFNYVRNSKKNLLF